MKRIEAACGRCPSSFVPRLVKISYMPGAKESDFSQVKLDTGSNQHHYIDTSGQRNGSGFDVPLERLLKIPFRTNMLSSKLTGAHTFPLLRQAREKKKYSPLGGYQLTPISPQSFWNPKPRESTSPFHLTDSPDIFLYRGYWYIKFCPHRTLPTLSAYG